MKLRDLKINHSATILEVGGGGALRQHFLDMGLIPGQEVTLVKYAPLGDPMELSVQGYSLTLRLDDAANITIGEMYENKARQEELPEDTGKAPAAPKKKESPHPGLGEEWKTKSFYKEHQGPVLDHLTFALAGNQNSGKTTLFNQLTGSNQHVGNFPGVTVDRKSGAIKGHPETEVTDLPGIYSLSPYTSEEIVSRQFILEEKPSAIINIVDATNLERNLYLTMQLMELDIPVVLALNMMDEVKGNGGHIRINEMEEILQMPVVPISAAKNQGIEELVDHAIHIAKYQEKPGRKDFCGKEDYNGALHRCLHGIMHLIEDHAAEAGIPVRFAASKLVEGDPRVEAALNIHPKDKAAIEQMIVQMEEERGLDRAAAIADMRFLFIRRLCEETVVKPRESKEQIRSERIDRILTGKFTAIPMFILIMGATFLLTFNYIGAWLQELLDMGIGALTTWLDGVLTANAVNEAVHSLIIKGIFNGVGSVLSFVPVIVVLFFFLSMLEDSGYMARVAFVMDKMLRRIGLSGRSMVPMLIGFGCTVPAVMATRTLPSERDRRMTIMLTPFMSCSAKVPIYGFLAAAFFPGKGGLIMIALYLLGIIVGIITAKISRSTVFRGEAVPFVMELPNYRLPGMGNVLRLMWDKAKDFLQRAFSVILIGTIIVWFLQTFDMRLNMVSDSQESILAMVASWIAPIFSPLGFGNWESVTALISGFLAKESVVSILTVLYGSAAGMQSAMTLAAAAAFLVFCLLYTPCIAAIAAVRRESGNKSAVALVVFQCAVAWVVAFIVKLIGTAMGLG